jgi:hypothetical protein
MRALLIFAIDVALFGSTFAQPRQAAEPIWVPMEFRLTGSDTQSFAAKTGHYSLRVGHPDDASRPTVWDSTISIVDQEMGKTCESQPLLVEKVYARRDSSRLLAVSTNGSLTLVDVIDPATCKTLQRIKTLAESVEVKGSNVEITPSCECEGSDKPCLCSSGQVLRMKTDGTLRVDHKESDALTLRKLGVKFRGNRKVVHPRTNQAQLQ